MGDDDSRTPRPKLTTARMDRLVVPECAESIIARKPFDVDGMVCICGKQAFFVGIAEQGKACPYCDSSITARCSGCESWSCIGCLEKAAIAERELRGVSSLSIAGRLFS